MSDTLNELREAVKIALDTIPDLQASAQFLANPTTPSAHVFPGEIEFHKAMGNGHADWHLTVQAFVTVLFDSGAQKLLDKYIAEAGEYSVKAAIEADGTLGGVADDLIVESCSGYRVYPRPEGSPVLGAEWKVRIMA